MLQSDVAQLHTTRQLDHHLALVALKSPAIPREHIWLQAGRQTHSPSEPQDRLTPLWAPPSPPTPARCPPRAPVLSRARSLQYHVVLGLTQSLTPNKPGPASRTSAQQGPAWRHALSSVRSHPRGAAGVLFPESRPVQRSRFQAHLQDNHGRSRIVPEAEAIPEVGSVCILVVGGRLL